MVGASVSADFLSREIPNLHYLQQLKTFMDFQVKIVLQYLQLFKAQLGVRASNPKER